VYITKAHTTQNWWPFYCDVHFVTCCRNLDIIFVWRKKVRGIPHEVPMTNFAHTVVSRCY